MLNDNIIQYIYLCPPKDVPQKSATLWSCKVSPIGGRPPMDEMYMSPKGWCINICPLKDGI